MFSPQRSPLTPSDDPNKCPSKMNKANKIARSQSIDVGLFLEATLLFLCCSLVVAPGRQVVVVGWWSFNEVFLAKFPFSRSSTRH